MNKRKYRIALGLSGGVDSAVSAWLLKQAGHEVVGIFMKNWEDDDDGEHCTSRQDFLDAAAVADVLGIELAHVNFASEYKDRVFAEFLREYQAGRTPNPDVLCNAEIKFKAFLDHAMTLGADRIATGHYARVRCVAADTGEPLGQYETSCAAAQDGARAECVAADTGEPVGKNDTSRASAHGGARVRFELLKGVDSSKDQSYFLHRLTQAQLARTVFPLGEIDKVAVRQIAAEIGLPNAGKKDSTGICFIGERPFREFLSRYLHNQPGPITDEQGTVIGEHVGLSFYTLGQRQGLGIGGMRRKGAQHGGGEHAPWFVAGKDMASNTLIAVQGHEHPWLLSRTLVFDDAAWIAGQPPVPGPCSAKTRYRQADASCVLSPTDAAGSRWTLRFSEPQWAVTPGQSAVLYSGAVCLGGGVIAAAGAEAQAAPHHCGAPDTAQQRNAGKVAA